MLNIIQQGGWLMWIIAGSSIFAGLAFLERLFHLHRAQIASQDFLDGIYNVLWLSLAVISFWQRLCVMVTVHA